MSGVRTQAGTAVRADAGARGDARSVLFLAQLPPPVHGQSAMAKATHDMLAGPLGFRVTQRWGGGAAGNEDVGRRSFGKYLGFGWLLLRLAAMALSGRRHDIAYLGFAPWAHTALRDALLAGVAKLAARRTWVHLHGEGLADLLEGRGLRNRLARRLLSGTELIAVTGEAAREARRLGVFTRVFELPNLAADPGAPQRRRDRDELVVSCLCNLDPRKGVLDFVEAVGAAVEKGVRLRAVIAGGGTAALSVEELRRRVEQRGLGHVIEIAGRVDEQARSRLLADSDVFLYLSRHDLAPLALIEALAHGCAPLVLDIGGLRRMVGARLSGNVLEPSLDGAALAAEAADRLQAYGRDRPRLEADRDAARARYGEAYSPQMFRERLEALAAAG